MKNLFHFLSRCSLALLLMAVCLFSTSSSYADSHKDKNQFGISVIDANHGIVSPAVLDLDLSNAKFVFKRTCETILLVNYISNQTTFISKTDLYPDKYIPYSLVKRNHVLYHKTIYFRNGSASGTQTLIANLPINKPNKVLSDFKVGWLKDLSLEV